MDRIRMSLRVCQIRLRKTFTLSLIHILMLLVSLAMPKFKLMQKLVDNINLVSREILTGLSVIRAFGREDVYKRQDSYRELTAESAELQTGMDAYYQNLIEQMLVSENERCV